MGKHVKSEDLIGKKFNKLTINKVIESSSEKGRLMDCTCECGNNIITGLSTVKKSTPICDCQKREKQINAIGDKYNMLTILEPDLENSKNVIVQCECGNKKSVIFSHLTQGKIKACGCLNSPKDVVGEVYNRFTIIENLESRKYGNSRYKRVKVQCECGNIRDVPYSDLKKGRTKSCGCYIETLRTKAEPGMVFDNWTILREGKPTQYNNSKNRTVDVKCVCGKIKYSRNLSSIVTGKSKSCGCEGNPPKEKIEKEVTPIPTSTETENWREAYGFDSVLISDKGNIFNVKSRRYLNTLDKTSIYLSRNTLSPLTLNIANVMYQSFIEPFDEKDSMILFLDDNPKNIILDNLFLAVKNKNGK